MPIIDKYNRIGCVVDNGAPSAAEAFEKIAEMYNIVERIDLPESAVDPRSGQAEYDVIISIGGDGMMLKTLHSFIHCDIPVYGINRGSIGFLLNDYEPNTLLDNIRKSVPAVINPLQMEVTTVSGETFRALAINEVSLLRSSNQSAKISININGRERLDRLVGDGIILATAAGSSAYNFAAHGPLVPLDANLMLLTPIAPFRPRRWQGAIISKASEVEFDILEPHKRPVSASADFFEIKGALTIKVKTCTDSKITLLFDNHYSFEERILREQFET